MSLKCVSEKGGTMGDHEPPFISVIVLNIVAISGPKPVYAVVDSRSQPLIHLPENAGHVGYNRMLEIPAGNPETKLTLIA